jgi:hypothetical protein
VFGFGVLVMVIMSGERTTGFCPNTQMTRCKKTMRTASGVRRAANSDMVWVEMVPTNLHFPPNYICSILSLQSYLNKYVFLFLQQHAVLLNSFINLCA